MGVYERWILPRLLDLAMRTDCWTISPADDRDGARSYYYIVAADVYSEPPHVGRGGWTWYTGSAGWIYRAGIESVLGLRLQGAFLLLAPCIPKHWPRFEIVFQYASARYEIVVENPHGVSRGITQAELDGQPLAQGPIRVPLDDDGTSHRVLAVLG